MKVLPKLACCAALLVTAAACGEQRGEDGLTAEEREKLDQHAANLDSGDVVDASPDSLVANGEWEAAESGEGSAANDVATANAAANRQ